MSLLYNWIESIIFNPDRNNAETKTFFSIYRKLVSPSQLFSFWKQKLSSANQASLQENAMTFLLFWIGESYARDFNRQERLELINSIPLFPVKRNELKLLLIRLNATKLKLKIYQKNSSSVFSPKKMNSFGLSRSPSFDANNFSSKMKSLRPSASTLSEEIIYITIFSKFSPEQIAEALTMDFSTSFQQLRGYELIQKIGWNKLSKEEKKESKRRLPNSILDEMTHKFNELSAWVTSSVVTEAGQQPQKCVIEGMIDIAKKCEQLNNFDGCMAVLSGLNNFAVQRLKGAWGAINDKHRDDYQQLEALMNPVHNFRKYTEEVNSRKGACIPFVGLLLRDFTFIAENNLMIGQTVNMDVFKMIEKRLQFVWDKQSQQYELPNNYQLVLNTIKKEGIIKDDEELYRMSLASEPSQDESIDEDLENFETVSVSSGSTSSSLSSSYAWSKSSEEFTISKKDAQRLARSTIEKKSPKAHPMSPSFFQARDPPNSPNLSMLNI